MADIFISYSQKDREIAEGLAGFLKDCGYDVWWDYELVGGTKFRKEIEAQLRAAKAAIVIWTANSIESGFVLDEAQVAQSMGKLVPTRVPDLPYQFIPLGFKQLQTDLVTKPDVILRSLDEHGVTPSRLPLERAAGPVAIAENAMDPAAVAAADQFANWEFIKNSTTPADFAGYIARFPASPLEELARARLATLEEAAWATAQREGTPAAFVGFARTFPGGRYQSVARQYIYRLEGSAWEAVDKNDRAALEQHLADYPEGFSFKQVQERLADMARRDAEIAAWQALKAAPSKAALEDFLRRYPLCDFANEARAMLAPIMQAEKRRSQWEKIKDQNFSEQFRAFIAEFQEGPEVEEARERLAARLREKEAAAWEKVKGERHAAPLLKFMKEFPEGARRDEALTALGTQAAANDDEAWAVIADAADATLFEGYLAAFPQGRNAATARHKAGKSKWRPSKPAVAAVTVTQDIRTQPRSRQSLPRVVLIGGLIWLLMSLGMILGLVPSNLFLTIFSGGGLALALVYLVQLIRSSRSDGPR